MPYGGVEKSHSEYEYLVRPSSGSLEWIQSCDGEIADGAIQAGFTSAREPLYIGRYFFVFISIWPLTNLTFMGL